MSGRKWFKTCVILAAVTIQGLVLNALFNHSGSKAMIAGEIPEPGSVILLTMGAIAIFRRRDPK
jgi:hypothetical protein